MRESPGSQRDRVLQYVVSHLDENGYPPTYDEIREAVGLSSRSHVDYYLRGLEKDGYIRRTPRTPRGLEVVGRETGSRPAAFEVKVEGTIAAGHPLELADEPDQGITISPEIADPKRDLYALQVQGESMVDDLIADGDLVIVERQQEAHQGQMAVVHLQDRNEATLKRVHAEGERVRLQPAHPEMSPIYADARDARVQGRVVAVIRQL
jgi:repressor LexA